MGVQLDARPNAAVSVSTCVVSVLTFSFSSFTSNLRAAMIFSLTLQRRSQLGSTVQSVYKADAIETT